MILQLALRNLFKHWERYRVLLTTLVLGGLISVIIIGVTASMTATLSDKSARYFAGDVMVMSYKKTMDRIVENEEKIRQGFFDSGVPIRSISRRSVYYNNDATIFFAGVSQRLRRLIGVDWSVELESFRRMDFVQGGPDAMVDGKGILISDSTADRLKARVGDDCLVLVTTKTGQKNTVTLRVDGIFRDSSFFGYSSYLDLRTLNRAAGLDENAITEWGVLLPRGYSQEVAAQAVHRQLEKLVPTLTYVTTSRELDRAIERENVDETRRYAVLTLNIRLAQIKDILDALLAIGWILNVIFLLIVMIGVNNTYKMVVYERVREIGTMRALGMTRKNLAFLFFAEAGFLGLAGAVLGWILGNLVLVTVSVFDFGNNVLFAMFLERGKLIWEVPFWMTVFVFCSMVVASMAGALSPAIRAAFMRPVDALRQDS